MCPESTQGTPSAVAQGPGVFRVVPERGTKIVRIPSIIPTDDNHSVVIINSNKLSEAGFRRPDPLFRGLLGVRLGARTAN